MLLLLLLLTHLVSQVSWHNNQLIGTTMAIMFVMLFLTGFLWTVVPQHRKHECSALLEEKQKQGGGKFSLKIVLAHTALL